MTSWESLQESGLVSRDVMIGALTTYKLGGPARMFSEPRSDEDLDRLLAALQRDPVPVLVVGRGSNLVVAERGFDGLVVRLAGRFAEVEIHGDLVTAGGAVSLPILARTAAKAGRGGLEFFVGVPGSVGGAVVMNAGCHGTETSDVLVRAEIVSLTEGSRRWVTPGDLDMRYRHADVGGDDLVAGAVFRTTEVDPFQAEQAMREITRWRRVHQPGGTLNAGSVFKNPEGDAAGRIIDSLGLKGFARGKVRVSERHANFFVAEPDASAQEVFDLVRLIRRRVRAETGIDLKPEIRFAGSFDSDPGEASP